MVLDSVSYICESEFKGGRQSRTGFNVLFYDFCKSSVDFYIYFIALYVLELYLYSWRCAGFVILIAGGEIGLDQKRIRVNINVFAVGFDNFLFLICL